MISTRYSAALAIACATFMASSALASSTDDGNAGLEALNRGSFDEAIRLFTRAIKARDLSKDDQEFAYLNRGTAYLRKGDRTLAIADFRKATSLKPSDVEAQNQLEAALSGTEAVAQSVPPVSDLKAQWGPLAAFPGTIWMAVGTGPVLYVRYQMNSDGRSITFTGTDRFGNAINGSYRIDPQSGKISEVSSYNGKTHTPDIEVSGGQFAEETSEDNTYHRDIYTPTSPTAFQVESQSYQPDNTWKTTVTYKFVQVSQEVIDAIAWNLPGPKSQTAGQGFWKGLGTAIVQGAAAGVVSGLQPNPQQ